MTIAAVKTTAGSTAGTIPVQRGARSTISTSTREVFAGTSGWAYPSWKPEFYPADLSAKRLLEFYATRLNSVEVNYTFRKLPSAAMLEGWLSSTPADFRFSFKAPQRITHFSRLRECDNAVAEFVAALEPVRIAGRLGALLFQLPPNFKADAASLKRFLDAPAFADPAAARIAFEFRHESWFDQAIYDVLRVHDAALCCAESDVLRTPEVHCATDFAYYRLRVGGGYDARQVRAFAKRFATLANERDVYVYFKHEDEPTGALNATAFLKLCVAKTGKR